MAGVPMTATQTLVDTASLVAGRDFKADNDLLAPLGMLSKLDIASESVTGLLARVNR